MTDLPRYKSHKIVEAVRINSIEFSGYGRAVITHSGHMIHTTEDRYREKYHGDDKDDLGYYVRYEDGYESWSPTKAFEEGYTKIE
jgi:hypothetical protein